MKPNKLQRFILIAMQTFDAPIEAEWHEYAQRYSYSVAFHTGRRGRHGSLWLHYRTLDAMIKHGWIEQPFTTPTARWRITDAGKAAAP